MENVKNDEIKAAIQGFGNNLQLFLIFRFIYIDVNYLTLFPIFVYLYIGIFVYRLTSSDEDVNS